MAPGGGVLLIVPWALLSCSRDGVLSLLWAAEELALTGSRAPFPALAFDMMPSNVSQTVCLCCSLTC